ncbi:hypothetical protein C9374_010532 [Naegleria lovaniensis]|uniref:Uncharacterized protein n=1 Tax=Naegleria lovaniensis TaxID=51637 RepID=A0AA88GH59_NAELO|nr:uncharacterized protein C9374_010532 [Naegleria lovaniensis]KAG2374788.1 hypothetical protein C9374_010532 [Naegleria lovaniensis]
MRRENEFKFQASNFAGALNEVLKGVVPLTAEQDPSLNGIFQNMTKRTNEAWLKKLRSNKIVEANIFKHLHSELSHLPFVYPSGCQQNEKCKSFIMDQQTLMGNETFYLGRLLDYQKLPTVKELLQLDSNVSRGLKNLTLLEEQGVDVFEELSNSFYAAQANAKQPRVMTNVQLGHQVRFLTSLISLFLSSDEEKEKLTNLIQTPNPESQTLPTPQSKNIFMDINRVPVSTSCPNLGASKKVNSGLGLLFQQLDINNGKNVENDCNHSPPQSSTLVSSQLFKSSESYFHSHPLMLTVVGENSKNVLEFKTHLRRIIYQCVSDLVASHQSRLAANQTNSTQDQPLRSIGVMYDRYRIYLIEFMLSTDSGHRCIVVDGMGINYSGSGQGMALVFNILSQYLISQCIKMGNEDQSAPTTSTTTTSTIEEHKPLSYFDFKYIFTQLKLTYHEVKKASSSHASMAMSTTCLDQVVSVPCNAFSNVSGGLTNSLNNNSQNNSGGRSSRASSLNSSVTSVSQAQNNDNVTNSANGTRNLERSASFHDENSLLNLETVTESSCSLLAQQESILHGAFSHHHHSLLLPNTAQNASHSQCHSPPSTNAIISRTSTTSPLSMSKPMLNKSAFGINSTASHSTSSLPIPSSSSASVSAKGMKIFQRSKAILNDATNFNYFDKFRNVVKGPNNTASQQQSSPQRVVNNNNNLSSSSVANLPTSRGRSSTIVGGLKNNPAVNLTSSLFSGINNK